MTKQHNSPLIQAIMHAEGGFPLIALCDMHQVICVMEVKLQVDSHLAWGIQEIGNMWEWVMIHLCDLIKAMEVYAETKRAVFLAYKEHRHGVGGRGRTDEAGSQVLIEELAEGL